MDLERRDGECPTHGARSPLAPIVIGCGGKECYRASTEVSAYPAGTLVDGLLFMTSDAPEAVHVHISLLAGGMSVGATSVDAMLQGTPLSQVDNVWIWTEVPFSFELDAALPAAANVSLVVDIDYTWSYFIGNTAEHPSGFTIGGAHVVD
jgi:hypothetical protein